MPKKKKSSLGRKTPAAKRDHQALLEETEEETDTRRKRTRASTSLARSRETEAETDYRRQQDNTATSLARSRETEAETDSRRQQANTATSLARSRETEAETDSRRQQANTATSLARSRETEAETDSRRKQDSATTSLRRSTETPTETQIREHNDRSRYARSRAVNKSVTTAAKTLPMAYYYAEADFTYVLAIGSMDVICPHCGAKRFPHERPGFCCSSGKVKLDSFPPMPQFLNDLINGQDQHSKHFMSNIRRYNSLFQMTNFAANMPQLPGWNPTFTIHGQIFHRIGSLNPPAGSEPQFLQIYFIDNQQDQIQTRMNIAGPDLNIDIVNKLSEMLHEHNKYVRSLKCAKEIIDQEGNEELRIVIHEDLHPVNEHHRRYNAPTCNEVGILMPDNPTATRDIVLHQRDGVLKHISELHRAYDPLQYPLLFPLGTDGYSIYLRNPENRKITQLQYYAYHIQTRAGNDVTKAGRLFQQFLVDVYCKVETERLHFLRREQKALRADSYQSLRDSIIAADSDPHQVGQRVILPSSYMGSPRYMHERQQDAITYVTHFGRPQLFLTSTTSPKWEEIVTNLLPGQTANDNPVLTTRVFNLKKNKLMDLIKQGSFGTVAAWLYSIEFQKRGLPHVHILAWLTAECKIVPDNIDKLISAEIPSRILEPKLADLVRCHMLHGPCGALGPNSICMKDGQCSKHFPKDFRETTEYGNDGYPKYRRRAPEQGGNTVLITRVINGKSTTEEIDNRFVVPYNRQLLSQMKCHTNVEICSSVKSIKYVLKYVNKGSDKAIFSIQLRNENDEILLYQESRYVGSMEAAHRLLGFPIHEHWPPVQPLAIHLENGQRVHFTPETAQDRAQGPPPQTTLTQFMDLARKDSFAKTLLYYEVPMYYTWNNKQWSRRKQGTPVPLHPGIRKGPTLGRVYSIHPNQGECYYLRLLLHTVPGPTSFEYLRTVDSKQLDTYREACLANGLLENDQHLSEALRESCTADNPHEIRRLFSIIIATCVPADPMKLWDTYKNYMTEDIARSMEIEINDMESTTLADDVYNETLCLIEDHLMSASGKTADAYGLPKVVRNENDLYSIEYRRHMQYDTEQQNVYVHSHVQKLTDEQRAVYDNFVERIATQTPGILFLDAPGGTGKTFLINILLALVRSEGHIALACASSGIAATLLTGGRTIHATLKVPLNLHLTDEPTCPVKKGTSLAQVLKECHALIIDEAPMTHRKAYEAIDRTLKDIRENTNPFGGIPVLLCGDFRQLLPVVRHGTRPNIIDATLKKSHLWNSTQIRKLSTNMRVHLHNDTDAEHFSAYLRNVGDGNETVIEPPDIISLEDFNTVSDMDMLIEMVYPNIATNAQDPHFFLTRSILTPLNDTVNMMNLKIISNFPGQSVTYPAINSTLSPDDAVHYPVEFLNTIEISGLPPHILTLKVGCPVILLRNLDPPHLTNGTRCIVKKLRPNLIEVQILHGPSANQNRFIPRIPIIPSDSDFPFQFKRIQFPLKPSFSMTINKAQGQTFETIGLNLTTPIFTHGMLYVALSRVGNPNNIYVLTNTNTTRNVVYKEIL